MKPGKTMEEVNPPRRVTLPPCKEGPGRRSVYALKQERLPVHMSFNSVACSNPVNNVSILQGIRSLGEKVVFFFFFFFQK